MSVRFIKLSVQISFVLFIFHRHSKVRLEIAEVSGTKQKEKKKYLEISENEVRRIADAFSIQVEY